MTYLTKTAALTLFLAPSLALAMTAAEVDANGDGLLSVAEVQAVFPDVTAEQFSAMDLNADGGLDDGEVEAAQEAGLMPAASEG
ncbi:hypothetical protein [uncultured Sulfitobacter sp.]|uniref:hypothetical protein n=1 Tax=uncultured Sulfitobacter sp. TaxID=191468 RepID=UPI002626061B|nr:hypothetical protein [uncultured Sulfitobacter sp.]